MAPKIKRTAKQGLKKDVEIRPFRSSLKPMRELFVRFKEHMQSDLVRAVKETPFGAIFMAFYNGQIVEEESKGIKSNQAVLRIVDTYQRDSKSFCIGGKQIQITTEDVALTFGLPLQGDDLITNKRCTGREKERGFLRHYFRGQKNITKVSIEDALHDLLVVKRRRNIADVTAAEQEEQQMTLNEVVKNIQKLTAQDFCSLIIMYMAATLLFPGNKCTVPWYLVEQIVNIHMMNRINWAKGVRQNLLESLEKFRVSTSELPGCTLQILYWFCERVAIVAPREEFLDKLPRAVRWDLHQLNIALDNNVDLGKIEKEKILNRMANITEDEMIMIKCVKKSEPTQEKGKQTDDVEVDREEAPEDREEQQEDIIPPREHGGFIAAPRDEAAEELVILRNQNDYLRGYVYQLEKQIEILKEEKKEREEKDRKKKERRMKRKLQEEEDSRKRRKVQEEEKEKRRMEEDENQRKEEKRRMDDETEERRRMEEEKRRKDDEEKERRLVEEERRRMEEEKRRKDDEEKERRLVEEERRRKEEEEEGKKRKDDEEKERRIMVEEKRMEEKRSEEKLADVTISFLYKDLDSKQRDVLKNFFDKASKR